ncbi:uncharacterized protein LOC144453994 isoform X1 [Glandiceps talaboti]
MNSICYFHEQTSLLKHKKRQKKTPDELPQSLRFAHLNPRIAAFLRQQERARARAIETGEGNDTIQREGGDGVNNPLGPEGIINLRDFRGGLDRGDSFFLPDIKDGSFSLPLLRASLFECNSNDGEEFTQKHLFQEATFAAPMLLIQLARILYLFEDEHLDLPRELVNLLLSGWRELVCEAQHVPREWQSQAYLEKAMNQQEEEKEREQRENKEMEEEVDIDKKKRRKKKGDDDEGDGKDGKSKDTKDGAPTILQYKKESHAPSVSSMSLKPKTRLERFKSMTDRKGSFRKGGIDLISITTDSHSEATVHRVEQPSYLQVINFTLSSKLAEDRGWIIHQNDKDDLEKQTVLEWARQRLQLAKKVSQDNQVKAKQLGNDKALVNRYYGDTKREAMMKYTTKKMSTSSKCTASSSRLAPPKIPIIVEHDTYQKFLTTLPDGTSTVYYPSGGIAILFSRCGEGKAGYYTLIYKDNPEMTLLAQFTPSGHGTIYHDNGKVKFLATEKGGHMADTDGTINKKWEWPVPHQKLPVTIIIQLNEQMIFRCINHQQMQVLFTCQKETTKFNLGSIYGVSEPKTAEEWGMLATGETFQSKAAKELSKPPPPKKKTDKDKKSLRFSRLNKNKSKELHLAELQKILEMPDKNEYDIPAEKELARLLRKIKNLTEDWMEHYRIAVGISSPHLFRMQSAPRFRKHRNIQSAKSVPDELPSSKDPQQRPYTSSPLPEPKVSIRAPSAPPTAGFHNRRPFSSVSTASKAHSQSSEKKNVRIEIDGIPADFSKSGTPVTLSIVSGSPTHGSPIPTSAVSRTYSSLKTPRATSTSTERPTLTPYNKGCPICLRAEMLGEDHPVCKCSRHKIPYIGDLEYDKFLADNVPKTQIIVICVVSTWHPEVTEECETMLTKVHENRNKNRTRPCYESRHDRFRLLNYDMTTANELTEHPRPLLLRRHNAVPGMFLIYMHNKLMFADHIFNGYGTAKKDFRAQLLKTERDYLLGRYLPSDFRFTPSRGHSGPRSAWGGEIGGTGVNHRAESGLPPEVEQGRNLSRTPSTSTLESKDALPSARHQDYPRADSAAEFLSISLSHGSYMFKEGFRHSAPPSQKRARPTVDFRKMATVK